MEERISKSKFKAKALEYLRKVEATGKSIVITDLGRPVLRVIPFASDVSESLRVLRGSVIAYDRPTDPVGVEDWETLQ